MLNMLRYSIIRWMYMFLFIFQHDCGINMVTDRMMDGMEMDGNDTMIRQKIVEGILERYDKRYPPLYNTGNPIEVKVQIYVVGIFGIDESEMKFSMSMYLRQQWTDPRLKYDPIMGIPTLELDHTLHNKIWVPDLSFMTDIETEFHEVTVPNKMMILHPTGSIVYSTRVTGTFSCFMHLQRFPFDKQICVFELESYGFSSAVVAFRWSNPAMTFKDGIVHSQFTIGLPESYVCDKVYFSGNYTCIGVTIPFTRRYGFYLIQVFAPSVLIVMLSWVSFWLDTDSTPARVSLGILTVLTICTSGHLNSNLSQRVSYIRAIDLWNVACLFFVFGAMIEYACIARISRVNLRRKISRESFNCPNSSLKVTKAKDFEERMKFEKTKDMTRTIDKISRVTFPVMFGLFNVFYWSYYMT